MGSSLWDVWILIPVIFILVYIGIFKPGDTGVCSHCGTALKRVTLVCPNCKKRLYK